MSSTLAQGAAGVPNYLSGSSPGRLERRVLSEERGKCYSPCRFVATPEPRHGARRTISIVDDVNLLSPQTHTSLPLPLGPLSASDIGSLEGEAEVLLQSPA